MATLNHHSLLERDPGKVGASLDLLNEQLHDGWHQAQSVVVPTSYKTIHRVAVCGMGGSHLGADILRSVWTEKIPVPITIVADYQLPAWVDRNTLVIASSYSGTTEETLEGLQHALKRKSKIAIVTSGGKLASIAASKKLPIWKFLPSANPSGQPRLGVGYNLISLVAMAKRLGWVRPAEVRIDAWIKRAGTASRTYGYAKPQLHNPAKQLAVKFDKKIPLLLGAEWTAGNLHTWHNQINENAKTPASWFLLPDLNHHLLEGLRNKHFTRQMHAVLVLDQNYHERTKRRFVLTEKILKQNGVTVSHFRPHGEDPMEKAIDLLAFGGYVSWYQSALRGLDPAPIPTVDFLKQSLGKR